MRVQWAGLQFPISPLNETMGMDSTEGQSTSSRKAPDSVRKKLRYRIRVRETGTKVEKAEKEA